MTSGAKNKSYVNATSGSTSMADDSLRTGDTSYELELAGQNHLYSNGPNRDSTEQASKYLSR
jgi:hypothetical protein